jgi:hypothetical protein
VIPQHIQELMNAAAGPTGTQSAEPCYLTELVAGTELTPKLSVTSFVYNSTADLCAGHRCNYVRSAHPGITITKQRAQSAYATQY